MGDKFFDGGYSQVGGSTKDVADASSFFDPTGNYEKALQNFQGGASVDPNANFDPQAAFNAFMGQSGALGNMVMGATSPLTEMLNAQATRQAKLGGEAALAAMPGGQNTGAGMAAFADAYAKPFADVANTQMQTQLGMLSPLLQSAFGMQGDFSKMLYQGANDRSNLYANLYANMANKQGEFYVPTYERKKSGWDYTKDVVGMGTSAVDAVMPDSVSLFGVGG
jgi:hypothetical protein